MPQADLEELTALFDANQIRVVKRDRAFGVGDDRKGAMDRFDPPAKLGRVGHRCRQAH